MRYPNDNGSAATSRCRYRWWTMAVVAMATGWTLLGLATPTPSVSTSSARLQEEMRSVWEGVYTVGQARRGRRVFRDECGSCHKVDEFDSGYATAFDLFSSRDTMPESDPGVLSEQAYVDLVAYMLRSSDKPAGEEELPTDAEALKRIRLDGENPEAP